MKIGGVDCRVRPFLIAEIGANHEGDIQVAKQMVREAARAGADAVKFQTYKAEKIVSRAETQRFAHFQRLSLSDSAFAELAAEARENNVLFMSTPFDLDAVEFLDPLVPAFKIASGDLTFVPLLESVAAKGKPIVLSTGMASLEEIRSALDTIQCAGEYSREEMRERVVLLHCVTSYPTAPEEANLRAIGRLREEFNLPVGYSDHTLGILACLGAAAMGACVIEKHFTLEKSRQTLRDHQLSADPMDLSELSTSLKSLAVMLGRFEKSPTSCEEGNRLSMRRSLAARIDIKAGDVISVDKVTCLRPGTGLAPSRLPDIVGRVAMEDISAGHLIPMSAVNVTEQSSPR
jgi:N,N'-diacetyllegionaminate synthase